MEAFYREMGPQLTNMQRRCEHQNSSCFALTNAITPITELRSCCTGKRQHCDDQAEPKTGEGRRINAWEGRCTQMVADCRAISRRHRRVRGGADMIINQRATGQNCEVPAAGANRIRMRAYDRCAPCGGAHEDLLEDRLNLCDAQRECIRASGRRKHSRKLSQDQWLGFEAPSKGLKSLRPSDNRAYFLMA